jgi:hypothetical protein
VARRAKVEAALTTTGGKLQLDANGNLFDFWHVGC